MKLVIFILALFVALNVHAFGVSAAHSSAHASPHPSSSHVTSSHVTSAPHPMSTPGHPAYIPFFFGHYNNHGATTTPSDASVDQVCMSVDQVCMNDYQFWFLIIVGIIAVMIGWGYWDSVLRWKDR